MNGPDCGPVNPLQSLLKHSERDSSIQGDRFQQIPSTSNGYIPGQGMRTGTNNELGSTNLDMEMNQFYSGTPASGGAGAFTMEAMKRELAKFGDPRGMTELHNSAGKCLSIQPFLYTI